MKQVIDLQSGRELRQDVVRNDRFSLGGIAPERGGGGGGGCTGIKRGCTRITSQKKNLNKEKN